MDLLARRLRLVSCATLGLWALSIIDARSTLRADDAEALDRQVARAQAPESTSRINSRGEALAERASSLSEDEVFGTYAGYNLDQYLFRASGPIRFPIYVTRVFSRNGEDYGTLLTGTPQLVLRVWDVDARCGGGCCEVDKVYLNGHYLEQTLDGSNGSWSTFRADIPVQWFEDGWVNDAAYNGPGVAPTPGENWVTIDIDTACGTAWAMEADYGELQIQGVRPAMLIHGIQPLPGADGRDTWNTFRTFLPGRHAEAFRVGNLDSTLANAVSIANVHLPNMEVGFGVNKVNVIGHSKGGLDSSLAALGRGDHFDTIVTLGSPMQGSEYADHFLSWHPQLVGLGSLLLNTPVALSLSSPVRSLYYWAFPNPEPGVRESYFAGTQYAKSQTNCMLSPLHFFSKFQIFSGANDGWVGASTSYPPWLEQPTETGAYAHTDSAVFQPPLPAPPTAMTDSPVVAEWAFSQLHRSAQSPQHARPARLTRQLPRQSVLATTVSSTAGQQTRPFSFSIPAGTSVVVPVPIDSSVSEFSAFAAYAPGPAGLQMALVSPRGQRFLVPQSSPGLPLLALSPDSRVRGLWQMELEALDDVQVEGGVALESRLRLEASVPKSAFSSGENVLVTAALTQQSANVPGATVTATLRNAAGYSLEIPLSPQGGVYAGSGVPGEPGQYSVSVTAEGARSGEAYERSVVIPSVSVLPATASIEAVVGERGVDSNGNGRIDDLIISGRVNVTAAGDFVVTGSLASAGGLLVANASTAVHLESGQHDVDLSFSGRSIRASGEDGPYLLADVLVQDVTRDGLVADQKSNLHQTGAYAATDFEGPILSLGPGSELVADTDGDGDLDRLVVRLVVSVTPGFGGTYDYNAALRSSDGRLIEWSGSRGVSLLDGANTLEFSFAGTNLSAGKANGPFELVDFHLYDSSNPQTSLSTALAYTTDEYGGCQFDGVFPCALKSTLTANPTPVKTGRIITVKSTVKNRTDGPLSVSVSPLVVEGTGAVSLLSGPNPGTASIPRHASRAFVWRYLAVSAGTVEFVGGAAVSSGGGSVPGRTRPVRIR